MSLTKKQRQILDFIEHFLESRRYSPSFREIADRFGYASLATVHEHLGALQARGYIKKSYNESRSIEVVRHQIRVGAVELELYGHVAAGEPIEVVTSPETIAVPEDMIAGSLHKHFVLRVRGDSMIQEQIRDGDYVIVQAREEANNGEMVIALVDGTSATMKRYYAEAGNIRLQPANPSQSPQRFDASQVRVQGVVIGVIRRY